MAMDRSRRGLYFGILLFVSTATEEKLQAVFYNYQKLAKNE
jgi:hypothetical protein